MPNEKPIPTSVKFPQSTLDKLDQAAELTGLPKQELIRLCTAIGLEDLKKVAYDLARLVSDAARPELAGGAKPKVLDFPKAENDRSELLEVLGGIAAGSPILTDPSGTKIAVSKAYPKDHYALQVFGESMAPQVPNHSYIVVKKWKDGYPKKGTIVVYHDAYGATLKVYDTRKAAVGDEAEEGTRMHVLRSLNPDYPSVDIMDGGAIEAVFVEVV